MREPSLPDKALAIHSALDRARLPHAFGGAMALAYYGEPRTTVDIDINVFVAPEHHERVVAVLAPLGIDRGPSAVTVLREGQGRWRWGRNPIDLFFSNIAFHDAMHRGVRDVPFGGRYIPILAAEHLVVAKAVFDRAKDWIDIEQVFLATPGLDTAEIDRWINDLVGAADPRAVRLADTRQRVLGR